MNLEAFKRYLNQTKTISTTDRYIREINKYYENCNKRKIDPKEANYSQLIEYIGIRRKQFKKSNSLGCTLQGLKHYYDFLVLNEIREDNPASSIKLRDNKNREIQIQDLFTTEELEKLLERKERYKILKNRNLLIISLFIYQGLANREIKNLKLEDIDLKEGTIKIKASGKNNKRELKLNAKQTYYLIQYLNEDRPQLMKEKTDFLLISKSGKAEQTEGIHYIIESSKHLYPNKKLNPITIRQSVIANLLKTGNDLRVVQAFAGHKTPSTTERYKQTKFEELKYQINKFHPLK